MADEKVTLEELRAKLEAFSESTGDELESRRHALQVADYEQVGAVTDVAKLIAETRELDAKATAGPWSDDDGNVFSVPLSERREAAILRRMKGSDEPHPDGDWNNPLGWVCGTEQSTERFESDSRLIARYRTLAPQLADALERAEAENARLREALARVELAGCPQCGSEPWVNIDCAMCRDVSALLAKTEVDDG